MIHPHRRHRRSAAVYFRADKALWRYDWTSGARPQRVEGQLSRALDVGGDVWALRGPHNRGITFTTSDGTELSTYASVEPDGRLSRRVRRQLAAMSEQQTGRQRRAHHSAHVLRNRLPTVEEETTSGTGARVSAGPACASRS